MSDKSQKIAKILLTAGAATIGIIGVGFIVKYHRNIYQKIAKVRNTVYDVVNIPRPFSVEVINSIHECEAIVARLRK